MKNSFIKSGDTKLNQDYTATNSKILKYNSEHER